MKLKLSILLIVALIFFFGCGGKGPLSPEISSDDEIQAEQPSQELSKLGFFHRGVVRVMTRNIYIGAKIDAETLQGLTPAEIPALINEKLAILQQTNFIRRARLLAKEIAWSRPHLIGLQEVALFKLPNGVELDYLDILLKWLKLYGQNYQVAGINNNLHLDSSLFPGAPDLQITDRDVVLVRNGVQVLEAHTTDYQNVYTFNLGGLPIPVLRGFVSVKARVGSKTYRFVTTHLETSSASVAVQQAQAAELVDALAGETHPIILTGDYNSDATAISAPTYQFLTNDAGYVDVWTQNLLPGNNTNPEGLTDSHEENLQNTDFTLTRRVDLILVRNGENDEIGPVFAWTVGDELRDRTLFPPRIWPSDHAGVVARLKIPVFGNNVFVTANE